MINMSTLYRKYRPQKFSDLVGQEHLVQTITNEISTGKVAHAYLFSGPRGIGKTTMARLFAKAINCENRKEGSFEPCDQCSSCQEITNGRNIDVIEIDAASHTGVDNVRENIIDNAQFKPTRSKYKVFIIDEVHMLSTSAFNALLKTLEEPPAHVIFILATTEMHKLPATIISRCQRFNFKKINHDVIFDKLKNISEQEDVKIEKAVLERIIGKSDGCLRDAESLLGQIMSLNIKKISQEDVASILPTSDSNEVFSYLDAISEGDSAQAIEIINRLANDGINLEQFALDTLAALRTVMITSAGQTINTDYSDYAKEKIKGLSAKLPKERLLRIIDGLIRRRQEIKQAPVPQLPLELLSIEFSSDNPAVVHNDNKDDSMPPVITKPSSEAKKQSQKTSSEKKNEPKTQQFSMDKVNEVWPEMISRISEKFPSIVFILKMTEVKSVDGQELNISVPYSLHKEKLEETKLKKSLEDILSELLGGRILVACTVNDEKAPASDAEIGNLAAQFGGEVV